MQVNFLLDRSIDLFRQGAVRLYSGDRDVVMDAIRGSAVVRKGQHPEQSPQHRHIGGGAGQRGRQVQPRQHQAEAGGSSHPAADRPAAAVPVLLLPRPDPRLDPVRQLGGDGDVVVRFFGIFEFIHKISAPSIAMRSFFRPAYSRLFTVLKFCPVTWLISFRVISS